MTMRRKLPRNRVSQTHHFRVGEASGWLIVGLYDDGSPGEVFINLAKTGSTLRGMADALARLISHALQNGVPVSEIADSLTGAEFEPRGETDDPDIPTCTSLTDYIARRLAFDHPSIGAPTP